MVGKSSIETNGFSVVRSAASDEDLAALLDEMDGDTKAGRRHVLDSSAVLRRAGSPRFVRLVAPFLSGVPRPVRAIFFNKTIKTNWLVPWHQDLTIAVRERRDTGGFGPWTVKDGVWHVQPPVKLLEDMIALRLHFDDCDETNGALRVLPGTHRFGRISSKQIAELRTEIAEAICSAGRGDALLMRPLLLHASSRLTSVQRRRVLHIEYAGFSLPHDLEWNAVC